MGRFVAGEETPEAAEGALLQFAALWPVLPHLKQTRSPAMVLPLALIPELRHSLSAAASLGFHSEAIILTIILFVIFSMVHFGTTLSLWE